MGTWNRSSFRHLAAWQSFSVCSPGLALGAPWNQRIGDTELIVEKVMGSLGPQLDSAIEAAIRMLEGTTDAVRSEAVVQSTNVAVEANGEEEIIEVVIDQLGPSISSAVQAALASSTQDEARAKAEAEAAAIEDALNAQLALWKWARGEGGGARLLPGGVQHLRQEVNTQERNQTQVRADDEIQNTVFLSNPVLRASLNLFQEQNIQIRY